MSANILALSVALQIVIGLLTAVYQYKTLKLLKFNDLSSVIITLLFNSLLHVIFYETAILTESLSLFFITVTVYLSMKYLFCSVQGWKSILWLSLLMGYLVFIKPFYIFIPFVIYALYILKDFRFSRIINSKLILLIFPVMVFTGWSYINKINTGHFTSTTYWGFNIAQNCVYFAENTEPEYQEIGNIYAKHRDLAIKNGDDVAMSIWDAYDELLAKTNLNQTELSYTLSQYGKATIKKNPGGYVLQVARSWWDFWKVDIYWNYDYFLIPYSNKAFLLVWYIQLFFIYSFKLLFVLSAPYLMFKFIKSKKVTPEFIFTILILATSLLQAIATYGNNSRFSYPFGFLILITLLLTYRPYIEKTIKRPLLKN